MQLSIDARLSPILVLGSMSVMLSMTSKRLCKGGAFWCFSQSFENNIASPRADSVDNAIASVVGGTFDKDQGSCALEHKLISRKGLLRRPVRVRSRRAPDQPSDEDVADHALWHIPVSQAHRRVVRDEDEVPMVQVDIMNKTGDSDILTLLNCEDCKGR